MIYQIDEISKRVFSIRCNHRYNHNDDDNKDDSNKKKKKKKPIIHVTER